MQYKNFKRQNIVLVLVLWLLFLIAFILHSLSTYSRFLGSNPLQLLEILLLGMATLLAGYFVFSQLRERNWYDQGGFRQIFNDLNITAWSFENKTKQLHLSDGMKEIIVIQPVKMATRPLLWEKLVHPYDLLRVQEAEKDLLNGKKVILEYRLLLADGRDMWIQNHAVPIMDDAGDVCRLEGLIINITEQKKIGEKMQELAYYDALTGLPNRIMFQNYFVHCKNTSQLFSKKLAIVFIDLDSFKAVNDVFGHNTGDLLLKQVAERLKTCLRGSDLLSRLGGDEFIAVLTRISPTTLPVVAQRIVDALAEPFEVNGHQVITGASVGISIYPDNGDELETLLKNADHAMYEAKRSGKNTFHIFKST